MGLFHSLTLFNFRKVHAEKRVKNDSDSSNAVIFHGAFSQNVPLGLRKSIENRTHVASEKHSGKYAQKQAKKAPDPTPSSLWVGDDLWPPPLSFADAVEPPLSATSFVLLLELPFSVRGNILFGCLVLLSVLVRRSGVEFHSFESLLVGYIRGDDWVSAL
ncbi:hypothetical protein TNCV_2879571 [Trichonephila clavipes]|uniref:Uncharacterized protein n=1 Tax=Trichonephila clavipes TaxID=2585209 RepID=A0A8X7BDH0_TRICX|nr:hypothetical protein TNCV_2879571 [Trichonephila clavipes]